MSDDDNASAAVKRKTIAYLEVQCEAGLQKMYDTKLAIADKLTSQDGEHAIGKMGGAHKDLVGVAATNDLTAESVFGMWKSVRRRHQGISWRRSSGLAQEMCMKYMSRGYKVRQRKKRLQTLAAIEKKRSRREKQLGPGLFHRLPRALQEALVEFARVTRKAERKQDRADEAAIEEKRVMRRRTNSELELESLVKQFGMALSFYDRYKQRGITSVTQLVEKLTELKAQEKPHSSQLRLDWLREQIEMRTIGFGWVEFAPKWSSGVDEEIGSVADLTGQLKEILEEEVDRDIPKAAIAPLMRRKTFKELGEVTMQAERLAGQRLSLSPEDLLQRAQKERARLEATGVLDSVEDQQPEIPPPLNESLIGKKIEIRWRYWRKARAGEKGKKKQVFIWCEGTVVEVADGLIKKSPQCKEALPPGSFSRVKPAHMLPGPHVNNCPISARGVLMSAPCLPQVRFAFAGRRTPISRRRRSSRGAS
jgi:hypothetical protein